MTKIAHLVHSLLVFACIVLTISPTWAGPVTIPETKCVVDNQTTNTCQFTGRSSCPQPLQHTDFYCSTYNLPSTCQDATPKDTCKQSFNVSCGFKTYCDNDEEVKDSSGNSLKCTGQVDTCI